MLETPNTGLLQYLASRNTTALLTTKHLIEITQKHATDSVFLPVYNAAMAQKVMQFCSKILGCNSNSHSQFSYSYYEKMTALVLFLTTDPEARVRFPALSDFVRSSGSGTGSTQTS
jgi:hypothetical protein